MKLKCQIVEQYKSLFIIPTIWIFWDGVFTISVGWFKWCVDIDFVKKS